VKVLDYIGLDALVTMAHDLGMKSLEGTHPYGLALTLGGGEVSLLELTGAYAAFAAEGELHRPVAITRIEDRQGNLVWTAKPGEGRPALDPRVAYLITDILSDSYARLTGFGEGSILRLSHPAAVKTGTTTDWRDNWTVGYTPQLVAGVWVGNADNTPMYQVSGVSGAAPIWHDFMEQALKGKTALPFREPPGLVRVTICADSGHLPGPGCPRRREEIFLAGTEPQRVCTLHTPPSDSHALREASLSEPLEEAARPADRGKEKSAQTPGVGTSAPVDYVNVTSQAFNAQTGPALLVSSPDPNARYQLSSSLPPESQRIPLSIHASLGTFLQEVTILVDGDVWITLDHPPYRSWWPLRPGRHWVLALASDEFGNRWTSPVVAFTVVGRSHAVGP